MKLDGKEFDIKQGCENDYFAYMDSLEKQILSKHTDKEPIPECPEGFIMLLIADHALAIPQEAKAHIEKNGWITYLE